MTHNQRSALTDSARSGAWLRDATQLRRDIVEALYHAKGGHYGGSMSVADILLTLYRSRGGDPRDPSRDRIILSKGHSAIALYAVLNHCGYSDAPLRDYGSLGSPLEGHPDMTALPAVDFSTGSLGQGLAAGLGMSIALRSRNARVWVVLGDGECQEGEVWEAAMLAARLRADNLIAIIDANGFQEWGWNGEPIPQMGAKWSAFGWRVLEVDGHDHEALVATYDEAAAASAAPTAIVAKTVKGKGVPLLEADPMRFHCATVTDLEHAEMLRSLR